MKPDDDFAADRNDCSVEPLQPDEFYLSWKKSPVHERENIRAYIASQSGDETVVHLEKVATEGVYGRRYDVWDVHTDKGRWWVITLPTSLYSQTMFPSMDMCLSLHIGISARLMGSDDEIDEVGMLILKSQRRLDAAAEALYIAREVEDYQAVGMKLRETLLALVRDIADPSIVPPELEQPKLADFVNWAELIVQALTSESNLHRLRAPLKILTKQAWKSVNDLTHTTSADETLAAFVLREVQHVFEQFAMLLRATGRENLIRCPSCDSTRVTRRASLENAEVEELRCEVCGATARRMLEMDRLE